MAGPRTTVRDLNRTREKILVAALAEFSARGFAGARVDAIARRARVNKRMLYYCFGAKQDLYREILRRKIAERAEWLEATPDDLDLSDVRRHLATVNHVLEVHDLHAWSVASDFTTLSDCVCTTMPFSAGRTQEAARTRPPTSTTQTRHTPTGVSFC